MTTDEEVKTLEVFSMNLKGCEKWVGITISDVIRFISMLFGF